MNTIKQNVWKIVGGAALLAASFALGYWGGNKNRQSPIDTPATLTSSDMEHAFGNRK